MSITAPPPLKRRLSKGSSSAKTAKFDEGAVITLTAVYNKLKEVEQRVQQQTELRPLIESVSNKIIEVENKLTKRIEEEISSLAAAVAESSTHISALKERVEKSESGIECLKAELAKGVQQKSTADFAADAVAFGVAYKEGKNLKSIFNQVCLSIDFLAPHIRDIFRTRPSRAGLNGAIVIKFHSPLDRNRTLRAFGDYRRRMKSAVPLQPLDIQGNFHIFESLTKENRLLLQAAIKLRREGKLQSAFTLRGCVHVRSTNDKASQPTKILCEDDLEQFR
ncbi:PREDICTED: uncharacterized protein LOC108362836 [Rhagoletis zephyria]|uniref:uncharacterized protein LOC108362836 n=1 Tax=Rhagoletis zephyria TaxID=28612 RepID=UPI00081158DA|nr:PREDICTED: uncharacterized protein LOC108362836 [Rhagoletis zephyria]